MEANFSAAIPLPLLEKQITPTSLPRQQLLVTSIWHIFYHYDAMIWGKGILRGRLNGRGNGVQLKSEKKNQTYWNWEWTSLFFSLKKCFTWENLSSPLFSALYPIGTRGFYCKYFEAKFYHSIRYSLKTEKTFYCWSVGLSTVPITSNLDEMPSQLSNTQLTYVQTISIRFSGRSDKRIQYLVENGGNTHNWWYNNTAWF